jgi:hypothetical protein
VPATSAARRSGENLIVTVESDGLPSLAADYKCEAAAEAVITC